MIQWNNYRLVASVGASQQMTVLPDGEIVWGSVEVEETEDVSIFDARTNMHIGTLDNAGTLTDEELFSQATEMIKGYEEDTKNGNHIEAAN